MQNLLKKLSFLSRLCSTIFFIFKTKFNNDTLTSSIFKNLDWSDKIVEIGSGDDVFSYIMHGGSLILNTIDI